MLENATDVARSGWSAERAALLAEGLRRSRGLRPCVRLRVHGASMLPVLWPGDIVEIESCSLEELRPGQIVLALRDGRLFLHRLVATQANGFVLRGDSMPGPDPLFPPEALLGRLVHGTEEERGLAASVLVQTVGMLLCYCSVARGLALKLHRRGKAPVSEFRSVESR